jgi:hypothetical protein
LRVLASQRDPESFHDREERVSHASTHDAAALQAAGFEVEWLRQLPLIYTAAVARGNEGTRLEWVVDSDYRFFQVMRDDLFGYVLHPVDLAMNKAMAAAGRRDSPQFELSRGRMAEPGHHRTPPTGGRPAQTANSFRRRRSFRPEDADRARGPLIPERR